MVSAIEVEHDKAQAYAESLESKVRERTRQLEELSRTDPLTGLRNVRHLEETLNREIKAAIRRGEPVCLAYIDLDGFKEINDRHGHMRGDELLRSFARTLARSVRAEDTCFRYGGDEFCVVLPACARAEADRMVGQRLREALEAAGVTTPFSFGVAECPPGAEVSARDLIDAADRDMLAHKEPKPPERSGRPGAPGPRIERA